MLSNLPNSMDKVTASSTSERFQSLLHERKYTYKTKLVCITPLRDERWILDRFLSCALLWADHVILGDNNSVESYDDILEKHDVTRVTVIKNDMELFNESLLRQPLLEEARKICGRKLFIFLDADEVLSSNILDSPELDTIISAPEGTVFTTNWFQLRETVQDGFIGHTSIYPMFLDDNISAYNMSTQFHGFRIPGEDKLPKWNIIKLNDISVVHYSMVDPQKIKIKIMWYQVQELLQHHRKTLITILRQYFALYLMTPNNTVESIPVNCFSNYLKAGIDMTSINKPCFIWQEKVIIDLFKRHGTKRFDLLDIWNHDWNAAARKYNEELPISRKRSLKGRLIRTYIRMTHKYYKNKIILIIDKLIDKVLSF
jgi:hypothetical protein